MSSESPVKILPCPSAGFEIHIYPVTLTHRQAWEATIVAGEHRILLSIGTTEDVVTRKAEKIITNNTSLSYAEHL